MNISCLTIKNIEDTLHIKFIEKENKMTNKEYIEKNNISFSEVMKMYDNEKYPCINDWLSQEHQEHKFKVGDFVRKVIDDGYSTPNSYVGVVVDVKDYVYYKALNRNGSFNQWTHKISDSKYHINDTTIFVMQDEHTFEKIF